jgi:hypothetical protein
MRIKVLILFAVICHSSLYLFAQDKEDRFHRYGSENTRQYKIFGGPLVEFSNVEGYFSIDLGATGGIMINKKFFLGLYGQKLITKPQRADLAKLDYPTFTDGQIKMIHACGVLGYIYKPEK